MQLQRSLKRKRSRNNFVLYCGRRFNIIVAALLVNNWGLPAISYAQIPLVQFVQQIYNKSN